GAGEAQARAVDGSLAAAVAYRRLDEVAGFLPEGAEPFLEGPAGIVGGEAVRDLPVGQLLQLLFPVCDVAGHGPPALLIGGGASTLMVNEGFRYAISILPVPGRSYLART